MRDVASVCAVVVGASKFIVCSVSSNLMIVMGWHAHTVVSDVLSWYVQLVWYLIRYYFNPIKIQSSTKQNLEQVNFILFAWYFRQCLPVWYCFFDDSSLIRSKKRQCFDNSNKKDGYRQQNVRQRQNLISIIDYDVCILEYLQPFWRYSTSQNGLTLKSGYGVIEKGAIR